MQNPQNVNEEKVKRLSLNQAERPVLTCEKGALLNLGRELPSLL